MSKLRVSADTSDVKKSLLDLSKDIKGLGDTKVSVFSEQDRKFIKGELNRELSLMKVKLKENKIEISKLVKEQLKMTKGSKKELDHRKKILSAYRTQTRLAKQMDQVGRQRGSMGGIGGVGGGTGGSGGAMGMLGKGLKFLGGAALAIGAMGIMRGIQGTRQYTRGARSRVKLAGLGVGTTNFGTPEELANAGLSEQDFVSRQARAVGRLGRAGGSRESVLGQAKFERSFGLEEGAMMNVSGALRGQFGGKGADQAQQKLQATILAAGIEDALGPYLEAATDLLSDINETGLTNTDEMTRLFAQMVKDGQRTPEQIASAFQGINKAVRGATGEANAFFQTAFAREGIGGGTIGATRLAMSSGGIFGLNEQELRDRGYNPELIKNMKEAGFMKGAGKRTGAIIKQFRKSAGLGEGDNISDITDLNTMTGLSQLANATLGTTGLQGFDALKMMEKVQSKQMTSKEFETRLQEMKDKKNPQIERLNKINNTLAGQTDILRTINTNLLENLGKLGVKVANIAVEAGNIITEGTTGVAGVVDDTGVLDAGLTGMKKLRKATTGGGIRDSIVDWFSDTPEEDIKKNQGNLPSKKQQKENIEASEKDNEAMAKAVEKGMTRAMTAQQRQTIQNNNKINVKVNAGGRVTEKTHK